MSAPITDPIARFDCRLRIAAWLLRAAPRAEHVLVGGMAVASAAAAWPFDGALYPAVAIPALLALAALIRHLLDSLDARREALAAAGAEPADALVIQVAGPLGATCAGLIVGLGACVVLGRSSAHALLPLAVGLTATFLVRRTWLGAPALAAGTVAAVGAGILLRASASASASAAPPLTEARSRGVVHLPATGSTSAWSAAWPTTLVAVLTLVTAQLLITRRQQIRAFAWALAVAAARRVTARSSA